MQRTLKMILEYDGTHYVGWQIQHNGQSVQALVQKAVRLITDEPVYVQGASRTDSGVHALGQTATFQTRSQVPIERFLRGLPSLLPPDIVVKHVEEMPSEVRVIQDARKKRYRYLILNDPIGSALLRDRVWHIRRKLNSAAMKKASRYFKGTHDFKAFMANGSNVKTTTRTILSIKLKILKKLPFDVMLSRDGQLIDISIEGNGFLRNQVRNMIGTLVEVGQGKRPPESIQHILREKKRQLAGVCAPAHGLYLIKVQY